MARLDWGYLRSWDDAKFIEQLLTGGYGGAMFQLSDPRLPQLVEQARARGLRYGIWEDPHNSTPQDYATRMTNAIRQFGASAAGLDLEFGYKGYEGSEGWNRNQELANIWRQMNPGLDTIIMPLGSEWAGNTGNKVDFNTGAWQGIATGWNPQSYGANMEPFDNRAVVQGYINSGVDPRLISPLLGQFNAPYGGGALYGLNEFGQLPKASAQAILQRATGGSAAPTSGTSSRKPKLSQSAEQVAGGGLKWGGQMFGSPEQFIQQYLKPRNLSYQQWAAKHPLAAQGLSTRGRAQ